MDKSSKKSELTFLQKIVLLALDDKGWFGTSEHKIKFGLAGAILFKLYEKGRITFREDVVVVSNPKSTDDVVLDRVLNLIKSSKKERTLRAWIQRVAYKKLMLRKTILKQLIQNNIINREEYSLLMVFYQTKFPIADKTIKQAVCQELYDGLVSDNQPVTDDDLMLLVVMNNCRMVRKNFGGFLQYLKLRGRINELTQLKVPRSETERVIKLLNTAISRAIMASNVSIHA